jgi:hypothetical protein
MSDPDRKKVLKAAFQARKHEQLLSSMALSIDDLKALFEHLDSTLDSRCDHTLDKTLGFLAARKLESTTVVPWLQEHGGYCDCEVLANVESDYERILR